MCSVEKGNNILIQEYGARWVRVSLQVNPFKYQGKNSPSNNFESESQYNEAILQQCESLGIEIIAITDHWNVDSAQSLIKAASEKNIVALPGFEANTAEGIHLLVIFEEGTPNASINAAIGACGVQPACANGMTGHSYQQIMAHMTQMGALVIPAHVNVPKSGMLTGRAGQPLISLINNENLHALAVTPNREEGTDQDLIIRGIKPYDRPHPLSVIHSDDIVHPDNFLKEGGTTWLKLNSLKLASIKLAVRTPETRVSLENPAINGRALLREIRWTGGYLDGIRLPLAPDLTTLIGGRGAGKSTVIESLRYVLDLPTLGRKAHEDHISVINKVIRSGSRIELEVDVVSPHPRRYIVERTVGGEPVVKDASASTTNLKPADVTGPIEIFGQHELAELSGNPDDVARMIQRFAGVTGLTDEHKSALGDLAENRRDILICQRACDGLLEKLEELPRLQEQMELFEKTEYSQRLHEHQRLATDESIFDEMTERINDVTSNTTYLTDKVQLEHLIQLYEDIETSPQSEILYEAEKVTTSVYDSLKQMGEQLERHIQEANSKLTALKSRWNQVAEPQREGHNEVIRALHTKGLAPDKFLDTSNALATLKAKKPQLDKTERNLRQLKDSREQILTTLMDLENSQKVDMRDAIRLANASTDGAVVVKPIGSPNRTEIEDVIKDNIRGQRTQIMAAIAADDFDPRALATAIRAGAECLKEQYDIRGMQAQRLVEAGEILCMQLEEVRVDLAVEVNLKLQDQGKPKLRKLDELSKGQRATALLLLLLGATEAPLIIDQPEDDLDNRFIYEGVVKQLRQLKGTRQIIMSTHNANIPVLGDSEMILTLDGDGASGFVASDGIGSLDNEAIRSHVENLLEGGPAAFNSRQHLYGF